MSIDFDINVDPEHVKKVTVCTEPNEEFDEEGNTTKVANLYFIQGVLGQGAFGTVRLARRKMPNSVNHSHHHSQRGSTPSPRGESPGTPHSALKQRRPRRHFLQKSQSAPNESGLFNMDGQNFPSTPENKTPPRTPLRRSHPDGRRSPSVVGNLGLFIRSKVSFDHDDDDDEQLVAVKLFSKSILKRRRTMQRDKKSHRVKVKTALQQVEREIALMKKLSHPNLVALYEVIDSPESDMLYMVLEYMPLGEILSYQDDGTFRRKDPRPGCPRYQVPGIVNGHFNQEQAALYFVDILHGLAYLHRHHICHRDLKPENILLDVRGIAKVGDFGVSHIFDKEPNFGVHRQASIEVDESGESSDESSGHLFEDSEAHPHNILTRMDTDAALAMKGMAHYGMLSRTEGTWCFWSPEMCQDSQAFSGYASDMWAAGVCLYIFVTGLLPFYSEIPTELFEKIALAEISYEGLGLNNSMIDLLKRCLEKDPDKRAGVGECLQHPCLQVAREKRIKQLSAEFEISRKRKIVLSEEDIKAAFRIITSVPEKIIKSASKTIHSGAKLLQESFAEARGRLSLGMSTASASSSFTDSGNEHHSGHTNNREGVRSCRARIPAVGVSTPSGAGDSTRRHRGRFLHKRASHESHSSGELQQDDSPSPAPHGDQTVKSINRTTSALSSACSFGSASGDDLPMILSEEDELDEDNTERIANETLTGKKAEVAKKAKESQESAPSKNSQKKSKKRRKQSKGKDGKCVIQ